MSETVGIIGWGTHFPATIETASDLVEATEIPEEILRTKMGIKQRHVATSAPEDSVTAMASYASQRAIEMADIDPAKIDLVISHGSEHKDHLIWNSASKIQGNVGAVNAYAFEMYALCAGAPIAMNMAKSMMLATPNHELVLLAAGSRENDLINLRNVRSRFMFNFGAGGGAMLLQRGATKNQIIGASAFTDSTLSETVVLTQEAVPEGDSIVVGEVSGRLDVTDTAYMGERLGATSMDNFVKVIRESVEFGGKTLGDIKFLGITHMKRSFYLQILETLGLTADQSVYLEDYGHIQSVDQVLALELGLQQGKINDGDIIVLAGAGTGYTWSAVAIQWG